jgi:hypothetical protein
MKLEMEFAPMMMQDRDVYAALDGAASAAPLQYRF